jgi:hypothetical protein
MPVPNIGAGISIHWVLQMTHILCKMFISSMYRGGVPTVHVTVSVGTGWVTSLA